MSTPENPESGQLTRRRLREIRSTAATPVIGADTAVAVEEPPAPRAPLPRAAEPVALPPAPLPDAAVDLGVTPLTRRQARQQERIRTASVPVITPDMLAAHGAGSSFAAPTDDAEPAVWTAEVADQRESAAESDAEAPVTAEVVADEPVDDVAEADEAVGSSESESAPAAEADDASEAGPQVDAHLGENILARIDPGDVEVVSFDELLARDGGSTGSVPTPHALILTHVPDASPLSAVTSTGEVIVTGIYNLPEGLGSQGHAHGTADGKEADAVLIDGELPASSSPTPIAASAAISTVRGAGEIIRPPVPEKSGRLVMVLAIAAAVALVAAVGLLIVALGVFR